MKFVSELEGLVSKRVSIIKGIYKLSLLEAKLAGKSIFPFFVCLIFLMTVTCVLWASFILMLGLILLTYFNNLLLVLPMLIIIQGGLFLIMMRKLRGYLQDMGFARTRASLNHVSSRDVE